jgi:tetratricopeptide (TPR) repeat protein
MTAPGQAARDEGKRSVKWLKKALGMQGEKRDRERATALVTQGVVHAREGRLDAALSAYQGAVAADEGLGVAWLNLGLCRLDLMNRDLAALDDEMRAGALQEIAASLEKALALEPGAFVGWRALARVEERRASWDRAEAAWQRAEATAPKDSPAVTEARKAQKAIARRAAAERARRRALRALEARPADGASAGAQEEPGAQDGEQAAALVELTPFLDEVEDGVPLVPRGAALAGTLARRAGDRQAARAHLERAVAADPYDVEALRELASVCIADGDLARALSASLEAYRERPTDPGLVCNVGVCHLGLGDVDQAEEFIELAHQLEPRDPIVARAREALARARAAR